MNKVERSRRVVAIIVADEKPVVGTIELAERFDISQQAMSKHLKDIAELGYLHTDKIGRSRVWWPTQSGLSLLDP
jgi:predicted transcriptional regulator